MKCNLIVVILLFTSVLKAQKTDTEKAKAAYMDIIDCYFKKDCDKFYSYFGDSVTNLGGHFITTKKMLEKKDICSKFDSITKITKTKENYVAKYRIDIFSYKEFSSANKKFINDYVIDGPKSSLGGFILSAVNCDKKIYSANDYLIIGDICRDPKSEVHIGTRYIFIIRKTPKGFKIAGLAK